MALSVNSFPSLYSVEEDAPAFRHSLSIISASETEEASPGSSSDEGEIKDLWSDCYRGSITDQHLHEIKQELGLIQLCWEKIENIWDRRSSNSELCESYATNTEKEKLLLWYADNFQKQFHYKFPKRRPILLACHNECDVQKMVCTTIRPTSLRYEELQSLTGCANFLADHIEYTPLADPTALPYQIVSPGEVLARQKGHCFEIATLLVSFLIGASYNAFVVSGYATREICNNDSTRMEFIPSTTNDNDVSEGKQEIVFSKYEVEPPRDLRSQFLLGQQEKEKERECEARMAQLNAEQEAIREFEKPPPDPLTTFRRHAWVLILPSKDVEEPCFVEPASGAIKSIYDPGYHGIDSVWNHVNYWVAADNNRLMSCKNIIGGLDSLQYWEHLLLGVPAVQNLRNSKNDPDYEGGTNVNMEKRLDMPYSWVKKIILPHSDFERRYINCQKIIRYRKCTVEHFSPYSDETGLSTRTTYFNDYDCNDVESVIENYCNRADRLYLIEIKDSEVHQKFHPGREDALNEYWFENEAMGFPTKMSFKFYNKARQDGLLTLCKEPDFMNENFQDREDLLYFRNVVFINTDDPSKPNEKKIEKIVEKYNRNISKPVSEDAAVVEYDLINEKIRIVYQYGDEEITAGTREFCLKEMKQIASYNPTPRSPNPSPLTLYYWLQSYVNGLETAQNCVRNREKEIENLLLKRARETAEPQLVISPFDEERNEEAKECYKERERNRQEAAARDLSLEVDLLAPYLSALPKPHDLSPADARCIYEQCLLDWKIILIRRATNIQRQFEQGCHDIKEFGESRYEGDNEYFKKNPLCFQLHCLKLRLIRHKELAPQRYLAIESCLRVDKRLAAAFDD